MAKEITIDNALEQAMVKNALEDKREWEAEHNQDAAVEAIDNILDQL